MQIDVISDTVCPWCFIGKRRLGRALALRPGIAFDVHWRPFRLNPDMPRAGMPRQDYLAAKFGAQAGNMHDLVIAEGLKEGIRFDFPAIARAPNTIDSHRLVRWAGVAGVQDEVVERLFIAYFENGEDISNVRVLADIADLCGMDGVEIAELLESDADAAAVEREERVAREMGVTGVPAMIFGGRLAVSGAREPEVLTAMIDQVLELPQSEAAPLDEDADETADED